jgi:hypothetical protein
MEVLAERLIWVVNGFLTVIFFSAGQFHSILLAVSSIFFVMTAPMEQKTWTIAAAILSLLASLVTPAPAPLFLLVMSAMGWAALYIEKYNRISQRWTAVKGQSLYALLSMGYALWRGLDLGSVSVASDPAMAQGMNYLNMLIGIALYVFPIGFMGWVAQSIWAHPPAPASPEPLISAGRSRGKR